MSSDDPHVDFALCLSHNAVPAARRFADWLMHPARDAEWERLGARRIRR